MLHNLSIFFIEINLTCQTLECHREIELELLELTIFSLELAKLESETTNFKIIEEMQSLLEIEVDLDASKVRSEKTI